MPPQTAVMQINHEFLCDNKIIHGQLDYVCLLVVAKGTTATTVQ
jgi:hypothetical protein